MSDKTVEEQAAELGLTLPPGYQEPEVSLKPVYTMSDPERVAAYKKKKDEQEAAWQANAERLARMREVDKQVATALGWTEIHLGYPSDSLLPDDGWRGRDRDGIWRTLPKFSLGGWDTMNLMRVFKLGVTPPNHFTDHKWCVHGVTGAFTPGETLEEAVCLHVLAVHKELTK